MDNKMSLEGICLQSIEQIELSTDDGKIFKVKGGVGKFEKPARDTLFVIFHGMLLTSR